MFVRKQRSAQEVKASRLLFQLVIVLLTAGLSPATKGQTPTYTIDQGVALADAQNPEIIIARKKVEAARGGWIEARSGYLPSVVSTGFADKRETQSQTTLREEDYNASVRVLENLYTGGAVSSQVAIARLKIDTQDYELQETANRVSMDVRIAFYDLLLNPSKERVREDSVRVLEEELNTQQERLRAGIVGTLNVHRAEVALANERPELFSAQTELKNSYLRLADLLGTDLRRGTQAPAFEVAGELQYLPDHPDLNDCLARADVNRPVIKARQKDI